jgi:hypothetical protein
MFVTWLPAYKEAANQFEICIIPSRQIPSHSKSTDCKVFSLTVKASHIQKKSVGQEIIGNILKGHG